MQTSDEEQAIAILEHLQNKGVINCIKTDGRFLHYTIGKLDYSVPNDPIDTTHKPKAYGDCPIPTLSRHILSTTRKRVRSQIQDVVQNVMQDEDDLVRTQWHWREKVPMYKIAEIPNVDYIAPVFPHVFTPLQAARETVELITEIQNDPDAQDRFIQQRIEHLHNQLRHKLPVIPTNSQISSPVAHDTDDSPIKHKT